MKTYDIKPPGLTEPVIKLRRISRERVVIPKKEAVDLFQREFFSRLKAQTVSFPKEEFFDEGLAFEKKIIPLNKKVRVKAFSFEEFLKKLSPTPFSYWFHPLFRFAATLVIISLFFPLCGYIERGIQVKDKVMVEAQEGYEHLLKARESAENADFESAGKDFQAAASSFEEASRISAEAGQILFFVLKHMPISNKASSGAYLLEAGESISRAGEHFLVGLEPFLEEKPSSYFKEKGGKSSLTEEIKNSQGELEAAGLELEKATEALSKVKISALPEEVQPKAAELKEKLPLLSKNTGMLLDYFNALLMILGDDYAKKYLFVFQNNHEARATGGFIGSYGVIDVDRGSVKKIFVDDIYNPDGQFFEKIVPPAPIQKIDNSWHMRDANWFCDFPVTAQKISWFYEKTGGPTVDGIIAMTPSVIEKLLNLTGPIEVSGHGVKVDSNNFVEITQSKIETDFSEEKSQPKKILTDLTPLLLDKVFSLPAEKWPEVLRVLDESLKEKHLLLFFNDEEAQEFVSRHNFSGEVLETERDFLMVVNSNIGGHKTDFLMEDKIYHHVKIEDDGRVIDKVIIKRKHLGSEENQFELSDAENWHKKTNYNYLRVLVPSGTRLLDASGFVAESEIPDYIGEKKFAGFKRDEDIVRLESTLEKIQDKKVWRGEEAGKTVFSGWVATPPKEESVVTLKYELPFKISFDSFLENAEAYSLLLEKQAGAKEAQFESTLELPPRTEVKWHHGEGMHVLDDKVIIKTSLNRDKYFGIVITK